jgi:hypothetical protein
MLAGLCLAPEASHWAAGFEAGRAGGITGWVDLLIPSPEEAPALLAKADGLRLTPPRMGFQRGFISSGIHGAVFDFYQPPLGLPAGTAYIQTKNTILLKLRI